MKFVILSIGFIFCCVSGNPAPQMFGYQQSNPVGQLVQGFQNSLQSVQESVSNALQSFPRPPFSQGGIFNPFRPETQLPNQIPNGPGSIQTGPIPNGPYGNGPIPNGPYGNGPIPNGPIPNGPYGNGPYGNGPTFGPNGPIQTLPFPYEQQLVQVVPNAQWPYRQAEIDEQQYKPTSWVPLPLLSQLGDPFIIIISRPSRRPLAQTETQSNSSQIHTSKPSQTVNGTPNSAVPQTMPTMTTTQGNI